MTDDRMALMEALQKADDGNFLRSLAETVLQILMEADVEGQIGAGGHERTGERRRGSRHQGVPALARRSDDPNALGSSGA